MFSSFIGKAQNVTPEINVKYTIKTLASDKYLDLHYDTRNQDGGKVQKWQKVNNAPNQKWILEGLGENKYSIKSVASNKYLDVHYDTRNQNGGKVQIWQKINNALNQQWVLQKAN